MKEVKKKLKDLSDPERSKWIEKARYRRDNRYWLRKSKVIAIRILSQLNSLNLTKLDLAELSGIPIQEINSIVKGDQDLTLSTIATLEDVLGTTLINISTKVEDKEPKESEIIRIEPEYYNEGSSKERGQKSKWFNWKNFYDGFRRKV